jgi:hypothetical protein
MGMNVVTSGSSVVLEEGENSIFSLLSLLPANYPILLSLHDRFYEDIKLFPDEISSLKVELVQLREEYCKYLMRKNGVRTTDESALKYIRLSICEMDVIHEKISEFILICEQAIETKENISLHGD